MRVGAYQFDVRRGEIEANLAEVERGLALARLVAACRYVDEVILGAPWKFDATWIEKYDIDLVVHGDDYSDEQQRYYYKAPFEMGIFRTAPYTGGISTTEIVRRCKDAEL